MLGNRLTRLPAGGDMIPLAVGNVSEDAGGEFGNGTMDEIPFRNAPSQGRERSGSEVTVNHDIGGTVGVEGGENPQEDATTNVDEADECFDEEGNTRPGRNEEARNRRAGKRKRRAHVHIATLNMNGKNTVVNGVKKSKWEDIENMMKVRRIGIVALQETHLETEDMHNLTSLHQRRLVIINSRDPERPTQSAGVAFALNKELVQTNDVTITEIIPGRALLLDLTWRESQRLSILNIYAPNVKSEQVAFWEDLHDKWAKGRARRKPDFMVGDFNAVEDDIDRAPARKDDRKVVETMREARIAMGLTDAWRHAHASVRRFTFSSARHSLARLDRICAAKKHHNFMYEWETASPPVQTDHRMVSVMFAPQDSPEVGKGRWTWPRALFSHPALLLDIGRMGKELERKISDREASGTQERETNIQTLWSDFKGEITAKAKKLAKATLSRINKRIETLQAEVSAKENSTEIDESEQVREETALMREEYEGLLRKARANRAATEKTSWMAKGEVVGPYWVKVNAEKKPRDLMNRLKRPDSNPPAYAKTSTEMAQIMRDHYDSVQRPPEDDTWLDGAREDHIQSTLSEIPTAQKLNEEGRSNLDGMLTEEEVAEALKSMPGNRATGVDGIPYEIWKHFHALWEKANKSGNAGGSTLNIVAIMTALFNDVSEHGVDTRTQFNRGWVCPLYKKKERTEAANYRPITLLNSDYKVMTKAITMRIAKVACKMIHPDQAGFVPGRLIFDHVRLSKAMIDYAEAYEDNGIIVALDQEKAYDRIRHDYLWRTLRTFNIPESMIETIKHLYTKAESVVIVNGMASEPFLVTRGVRQGDPLSCLLFDLAIEPLACKLRVSRTISGYDIEGIPKRIIVNLFADDTLVYLSEKDKFRDLMDILREW
jgi:exonuclease III